MTYQLDPAYLTTRQKTRLNAFVWADGGGVEIRLRPEDLQDLHTDHDVHNYIAAKVQEFTYTLLHVLYSPE